MKLKDCIQFYLWCDVLIPEDGKIGKLIGVDMYPECSIFNITHADGDDYSVLNDFGTNDERDIDRIKPILRPLSDMTDEEINHKRSILTETKDYSKYERQVAEMFHYMITRGFDLFDLIPSGQAIDKTKLEG